MAVHEQKKRIHRHPPERPWKLRSVAQGVYKVDGDCDDAADNRYMVIVSPSRGPQVRKTVGGLRYAEECYRTARGQLDRHGVATVDRNITVRALLEPALAATAKRRQHDPMTARTYASPLRLHFWPEWGERKARELTDTDELTDWLAEMVDTVGLPTARRCEQFLRTTLKLAVRKRLITDNPLEDVPWLAPGRRTPTYKPAWSEVAALRHYLATLRGQRAGDREMSVAVHDVLLGTGVRIGECYGFGPDDLDTEANTLTVRYQVKRLDEGYVFDDAKTEAGDQRLIPVPKFVTAALAATQLRNGTRRITLPWVGEMTRAERAAFKDTGERPTRTRELYFFSLARPDSPGNPGGFSTRLRRAGRRLGAKGGLRGHCYRHLYTTTLLERGVPQAVVDYVTGHVSHGVTNTVYFHVTPEGLDTARDAIGAAWAEASKAFTPPAHTSSKAS